MANKDIFRNRTALITGASSGIGREIAFLFAQAGVHLVLTARRRDKLESIKKEIDNKYSVRCCVFPADISVLDQVKGLTEDIKKNGLSIDILVNNAGFATYGYFHKSDIQEEIDEISVNAAAPVYLTRYFLPDMLEKKRGWVLNISSTASLLPCCPLEAVYGATKAFITSFSLALAEEYRKKNIHIACLLPGNTDTDFWERGNLKQKYSSCRVNMASAKDVAQQGFDLLVSGKDFKVFGRITYLKALLGRFLPLRIISRIVHRKHYVSYLDD